MKKKKIAFILPGLDPGGAERVVSTLANKFCEKYEISIITLWDVEPFYYLHESVKHIKCANRPLISKNIFQAIHNNIYLIKKLRNILKKNELDLVISFTSTANILALLVAKTKKMPCIICERSNPKINVLNKLWRYLRKLTYKKADFLVIQTTDNLLYFNEFIKKEKIIVIPNPLANECIKNKNTNISKENIILNVGRLDKNKSQDLLIRAFNNINSDNWRLLFVGNGVEKQNYLNLTKSLKLDSKVSFVGNSTRVYDFYNNAKIFAHTSKSEGFPNVLIEAMFFELPCISTNCPSGPSEIINNGVNGFLIPVDDQNSLEQHLKLLMSSEDLRKTIGKNAYESVKKYQINIIVEKWDELIQKLTL